MKKTLALLLILAASFASAQEATLNAPVARPAEAKLVMSKLEISAGQILAEIKVRGAGDEEIRYFNLVIPDAAHSGATVPGFLTALQTIRATETGGILRRTNFRVLGYFLDQGYLPGVTLIP